MLDAQLEIPAVAFGIEWASRFAGVDALRFTTRRFDQGLHWEIRGAFSNP